MEKLVHDFEICLENLNDCQQQPLAGLWQIIPDGYHLQVVTALVVVSGSLLITSRLFVSESVLAKRELNIMKRGLEFVDNASERKVKIL